MIVSNKVKPVLKWAGGKRQLLGEILESIPHYTGTYFEPFIGGGAVLFEHMPPKAVINDFNPELIILYKVIKDTPEPLIEKLKEHAVYYNEKGKDYYYEIRNLDRDCERYSMMTEVEKAARTVFLNRTCFNGLYRVNRNGFFNTPIGKYKNPDICCEDTIRHINKYFRSNKVRLLAGDYRTAIRSAKLGDFIYMDPPYYPISKTASFTDYTLVGFDEEEQHRLYEDCVKLDKKGVMFLQSNSDCEYIHELYKAFNIKTVQVKRAINSVGTKRIEATEVLISNYEIKDY